MRRILVLAVGGFLAVSLTLCGCSSGSNTPSGDPAGANLSTGAANGAVHTTTATTTNTTTDASTAQSQASTPEVSPNVSAGGASDVCSLMTPAQASSINKVTYAGASLQHVTTGWDQCTYKNAGQHDDPVNIYDLIVAVISVHDCYAQLQDAEGPGTSVSGIGDAAFGYQIGIVVKDGAKCVEVKGSTHAELGDDYSHDIAMAKVVMAAQH